MALRLQNQVSATKSKTSAQTSDDYPSNRHTRPRLRVLSRAARFTLGFLLILHMAICLAGPRAAAQEVLLVQVRLPADDVDPNVPVLNRLAEELDSEGRVIPIVWSLTDPIFRGAYEANAVHGNLDAPTEADARNGCDSLRTAWYMVITAEKKNGQLYSKARLFKRGSTAPAWTDEKILGVQISGSGADLDSTVASLGRTWAAMLSQGPFKGIPPRPRIATPDPDEGVDKPSTPVIKIDNSYETKAQALIKAGQLTEAVLFLRDAVDADPLDPKRRELLSKALLSLGLTDEAAATAGHGTRVAPGNNDLRLISVRAWLSQGKPDEAQKVLNEALARDPSNPEVQILVGDVALARFDPGKAVEAYTRALRKGEFVEARVGRACAYAASGWPEPCQADIAAIPPDKVAIYYPRVVVELERALNKVSEEVREIIRAARVTPKKQSIVERASRNLRSASGLARLAALYPAAAKYRESHALRDLAHNLLQQSCIEALDYAKTGNEDTADEATISLGEALKQFQTIRETYEKESAK